MSALHVTPGEEGRTEKKREKKYAYLWDEESTMCMVEGSDRKLEFIGMVHETLEVRYGVAVSVHMDMTTENSTERFPLQFLGQVSRDLLNTNGLGLVTPVILVPHKLGRLFKGMTEVPGLSHTTERATANSTINALGVLATRHLHITPGLVGIGEHIFDAEFSTAVMFSNCMLDQEGLAANVVSGAGED